MRLMPLEVLGTKAISSASAPTKRATRARTSSRRSIHSSQGRVAVGLELAVEALRRLPHRDAGIGELAAAFR